MYKITSGERMLTNLAVEYERVADPRLPACSRKAGKLLETCCTIMDLKGVTLTKVPSVYSYVRQASVISQNYYPERLGKLYLINAPWGFSTVWSVVKGWLDPVTVAKINILGSGYQSEPAQGVWRRLRVRGRLREQRRRALARPPVGQARQVGEEQGRRQDH